MDVQELLGFISHLTAHPLFMKSVLAILIIAFILIVIRFSQSAISKKIDDKDLRYKMRKSISLIGSLIALIIVASIFSAQMSNLTVIVGALSVGIGFAMRELIQSLIGWVAVSLGGLYHPGDRIQIGGIMGDVIDISPLTTTVMECGGWVKADLYNGRLARISNSLIFKEHVLNYTSDFPFLWDEITIPVRTNSDYRLARSIIEKVGKTALIEISEESKQAWLAFAMHYRVEDAKLEPIITITFDANWIEFTMRYVVDYRTRRGTKDKLFSAILEEFDNTQGKVQIASASMQLTEIPPLSLHMENNQAKL